MANITEVNSNNFHEEVLEAGKAVLVDFWAPWCGYCGKLVPVLEDLASELGDKVKIVKLNVDDNRGLAEQYSVKNLPTMILFKDDEPVERLLGFMPKATILAKISPLV
ncbi:MAG: thioredoxin [Firmicutes bacterium]|nr:thioredoxin [Bacillota bacterium]